jgi:hypothetical protein
MSASHYQLDPCFPTQVSHCRYGVVDMLVLNLMLRSLQWSQQITDSPDGIACVSEV